MIGHQRGHSDRVGLALNAFTDPYARWCRKPHHARVRRRTVTALYVLSNPEKLLRIWRALEWAARARSAKASTEA